MKAIIKFFNKKSKMYAAEFIESNGEFVIFELLDTTKAQIGNIVENDDFFNMGSVTFKNLSQNHSMDVFVDDIWGYELIRKNFHKN